VTGPGVTERIAERPSARPLRSDAERNRRKLLECALGAFAELGIEASVDEIARRAGVGVGTLYRRFPTKQALLDALADGVIDHVVTLAEGALTEPARGEGFDVYFTGLGDLLSRYGRAVPQILGGEAAGERLRREVETRVRRLISEAQEAGRLRADVTYADFIVSVWSLTGAIESTRDVAPAAWRRHLSVLLSGLRAGADGPLPGSPLTRAQLDRATALRRQR
jgi:AcrR family transcriptional regulator